MKRLFSILLVLCMLVGVFALTSCDKDKDSETPTTEPVTTAAPDPEPEPAPVVTASEMSKVIYDAAKSYYDKHYAVDNFDDLTLTSTETGKQTYVDQLEYKDDPTNDEEEVKTKDCTSTMESTSTTTVKTKVVDKVLFVEIKKTTEQTNDGFTSDAYEIKSAKSMSRTVATYTYAKIGENYYYIVVQENTYAEGDKTLADVEPVTTNNYYQFKDAEEYAEAVTDLIEFFNEKSIYNSFFSAMSMVQEMVLYTETPFGALTFAKDGNTYTLGEKATSYSVSDREIGVLSAYDFDVSVSYVNGKASKIENKMKMTEKGPDVDVANDSNTTTALAESSDLTVTLTEDTVATYTLLPYYNVSFWGILPTGGMN